ncbi:serine/threonine protein kinase [Paenibacillus sp. FSL M7-1046]|uniref:serine/threonine protein kinase n=1 Tax=Paenibacillus sp. FSL M7-1046 TaxID=2975315 RepID=UPI0030F4E292
MSGNGYRFVIDEATFQLQEAYSFDWLTAMGRVFRVFDEQDSGNISFGVEQDGCKYFVKFAGVKTMEFHGDPAEAVERLIQAVPLYEELRHPSLIQLLSHGPVETGYAVVFEWTEGECLHSHWAFGGAAKYSAPESPFYRFRALSTEKRLDSLEVIFGFHEYIESKGYVAVDFYDGSILYDFTKDRTAICDIDFYQPKPFFNGMGEQLWGSKRFKSPEEYLLDAPIDEITNVYNMGATAFVLLGGESDRSRDKWEAGPELYKVAMRAVHPERDQRYRSVSEFKAEWDKARKEANDG